MSLGVSEYVSWVQFLKWEQGLEQTDEEISEALRLWQQ